MKNGKIREYLQDCLDKRNEGGDKRQGISSPGPIRWEARHEQLRQQMKCRPDLAAAIVTETFNRYIKPEIKAIILDNNHWNLLKKMQMEVEQFYIAIKTLQGISIPLNIK